MNNVYFGVFVSSPLMHKWFHDNRTTSLCQGKLLSFYAIFYLYLNRNIALTKDRVIVYHFYFSWCSWAFADLKFFQKSSTSVSSVLCIYCPPNDKLSNLQQKSVIDHIGKIYVSDQIPIVPRDPTGKFVSLRMRTTIRTDVSQCCDCCGLWCHSH